MSHEEGHPLGYTDEDFRDFPQRIILGIDASNIELSLSPGEAILTSEDVQGLWGTRLPEWDSGEISLPLSGMQGESIVNPFEISAPRLRDEYILQAIIDRDSRLNFEEQQVYNDTQLDLEYGPGFRLRAHP